jgi:acyl-coenzyme A thioesterase PaaI-like protein
VQAPRGFTLIEDLPFEIGAGRSHFSEVNTTLKLFGNTQKKSLWGLVRFNEKFVGPPGHAHGGAQAYVLDEAMGTVCWNSNVPVVAKSITLEFKKPVPLHADLAITAQVSGKKGGNALVKSAIIFNGQTLATGKGVFHILTYDKISKMMGPSAPDLRRWFPKKC